MVTGLLGNESSDSNRFTPVTPKSENDVRLQATLDNQNPTGLPVGVVRDNMEYPGLRVHMDAKLEGLVVPIKIDISTGDVITPNEIKYEYPLLLEERTIQFWFYNLETLLAEKIQTILSRGVLNTRMRDFYDVTTLFGYYRESIDYDDLSLAFIETCTKRKTESLLRDSKEIILSISQDSTLQRLWKRYTQKYKYASCIEFSTNIETLNYLIDRIF